MEGTDLSESPSSPLQAEEETAVVLYTQPHCSACRSVERYLMERGITFDVRDVFADLVALSEIEDRGYLTTPVTRIGIETATAATGTTGMAILQQPGTAPAPVDHRRCSRRGPGAGGRAAKARRQCLHTNGS